MKNLNRFAIIGFMGVGKTTTLKEINLPDYYKLDLDNEIKLSQQKAADEIITDNGLDFFRNLETITLERIINQSFKRLILALGGGTLDSPASEKLISKNFKTIYLKKSLSLIKKQLSNDFTERPLINQIDELYYSREHSYNKADHIIICDNLDQSEIGKKVEKIINESI